MRQDSNENSGLKEDDDTSKNSNEEYGQTNGEYLHLEHYIGIDV